MRLAISVSIFCLITFLFGCSNSDDILVEEEIGKETSVVVIVDGKNITEEEIGTHMEEVTRDRAEENLSIEEIREAAIERAIRRVTLNSHFEEIGISVSEKEIEKAISSRIIAEDGVETEEEYFDLMARHGISRTKVKRDIGMDIKIDKFYLLIVQNVEVSEEEAFDFYKELEEKGETLRPFEEIKEEIKDHLQEFIVTEEMIRILDDLRQQAEIEILE